MTTYGSGGKRLYTCDQSTYGACEQVTVIIMCLSVITLTAPYLITVGSKVLLW